MKTNSWKHLGAGCVLAAVLATGASAQTLTQTFEPGEDASGWNSSWVAPAGFSAAAPGFLASSLGGSQSGFGSTSLGQEAYRDFRGNTAGVDVETAAYSVSFYLQIFLDGVGPASGHFYILDGTFGDYTANIRLSYDASGNLAALDAADGGGWDALGVALDIDSPYLFQFTVDPVAGTYSTTVSQVDTNGIVLSSATLSNLAITGNAINNHNNGQLLIHADTSAGTVDFNVDNIQITNVPEPASAALLALGMGGMLAMRLGLRRLK